MQTIENSLLQISINEKNARITNFVFRTDQCDYLKNAETQKNISVAFPSAEIDRDLANQLLWTIIDKGDSRVSLALVDTDESYKTFPYHFELVVTCALEGNQVNASFYLKNNSHKELPFSLTVALPILPEWTSSEQVNSIKLNIVKEQQEHELKVQSTDFKLENDADQVLASVKDSLAADTEQNFTLTMMLS